MRLHSLNLSSLIEMWRCGQRAVIMELRRYEIDSVLKEVGQMSRMCEVASSVVHVRCVSKTCYHFQ